MYKVLQISIDCVELFVNDYLEVAILQDSVSDGVEIYSTIIPPVLTMRRIMF